MRAQAIVSGIRCSVIRRDCIEQSRGLLFPSHGNRCYLDRVSALFRSEFHVLYFSALKQNDCSLGADDTDGHSSRAT